MLWRKKCIKTESIFFASGGLERKLSLMVAKADDTITYTKKKKMLKLQKMKDELESGTNKINHNCMAALGSFFVSHFLRTKSFSFLAKLSVT